jgi:CubicO group peptidase (beta-lactamase class C family)
MTKTCVFLLAGCAACSTHNFVTPTSDGASTAAPAAPIVAPLDPKGGVSFGFPDEQGVGAAPLIALAAFVRDANPPIFSILVSKNGVVIYELYTSSLTRDYAHYLMSVTKSVTSTLVGIAIDRGLVGGPEIAIADALPPTGCRRSTPRSHRTAICPRTRRARRRSCRRQTAPRSR